MEIVWDEDEIMYHIIFTVSIGVVPEQSPKNGQLTASCTEFTVTYWDLITLN